MAKSELTNQLLEIAESELARKVRVSPTSSMMKQRLSDGSIKIGEIPVLFGYLLEHLDNYCELYKGTDLFEYQADAEWGKKPTFPVHLLEQEDYFTHLSLSVIGHDLNGVIGVVDSVGEHIKMLLEREKEGQSDGKDKDKLIKLSEHEYAYLMYDKLRIASTVIPYIALGDCKYLIEVDAERIDDIIRTKVADDGWPVLNFNADQGQLIRSDEVWILYQLSKNARRGIVYSLKDNVISSDKVSSPSRTIEVRASYEKDEVRLVVSDDGCGIQPEVLPLIFGVYTSSGTGLGLQIVKRMIDLRKGDTKVISTTEAGDSYQYDLNSNTLKKLDDKRERGTTFEVYLKNKCN